MFVPMPQMSFYTRSKSRGCRGFLDNPIESTRSSKSHSNHCLFSYLKSAWFREKSKCKIFARNISLQKTLLQISYPTLHAVYVTVAKANDRQCYFHPFCLCACAEAAAMQNISSKDLRRATCDRPQQLPHIFSGFYPYKLCRRKTTVKIVFVISS